MPVATTNGIQLAYEVSGPSGPWVVLMHSLGADHSLWQDVMPKLADAYRVVAWDMRGHGRSQVSEQTPTFDDYAADFEGLLDHLGAQDAHLAGLSVGGMVAQTFALRSPGRARSLTLLDTTSAHPDEATRQVFRDRGAQAEREGMGAMVEGTLARWFTPESFQARPELMQRLRTMLEGCPPRGYSGACQAISRINTTEQLGGIRVPTLVMVGEEDAVTPVAAAQTIAGRIPGAELEIVPNAAHLMPIERQDAFVARLRAFLGKVDAARG